MTTELCVDRTNSGGRGLPMGLRLCSHTLSVVFQLPSGRFFPVLAGLRDTIGTTA